MLARPGRWDVASALDRVLDWGWSGAPTNEPTGTPASLRVPLWGLSIQGRPAGLS